MRWDFNSYRIAHQPESGQKFFFGTGSFYRVGETVMDAVPLSKPDRTLLGGAVITITKSITLYGGWYGSTTSPPVRDSDAHPTTLNGEGARRGVYIGGNITPTLQGLCITRGDAAGLRGYEYYGTYNAGGGVYVITATVTLADNDIFSNTARYGAGVFLGNSLGALTHSTIFSNTATSGGGGGIAYKGAPILSGNVIISNTSSSIGGGLYLFSTTYYWQVRAVNTQGMTYAHGSEIAFWSFTTASTIHEIFLPVLNH